MTVKELVSIDPESVVTKIAQQDVPSSRIGIPRRKMVSVGQGTDGNTYIQLGSVRQIALFVDVDNEGDHPRIPISL